MKYNRRIWALAGCSMAVFLLVCIGWNHTDGNTAVHKAGEIKDISLHEPMERDGKIYLRLADNQREGDPTSVACDYFANLVEERSQGRIEILTFHSSRLGDEKSTVNQLRYGGIDIVRVSIALLYDYNQELSVLQMPYLYKDSDHMWAILDSDIGDYFLASLRDNGMEGLCWYDAGARNFYTVNKEIRSVKDLEGLKIRVQQSNFMIDLISALGADPVDLPYEEVRMALHSHRIDGAENNFPSYISTGHSLMAPNLVMDEHTRIPEMIVMNKKILDEFSTEDQELIRQAALDSSLYQRELWKSEEEGNRKRFVASGGNITYVEDKDAFIRKVQPIYDVYGKKYKALLDEIEARAE